jgi:DNA-binding transcriptional MocR family regulator
MVLDSWTHTTNIQQLVTDTEFMQMDGYRYPVAGETAPRYQQLAELLAGEIRSGERVAGERLPSIRELARMRRVSINTAIAALRRVEAMGLIETREKSGHFVRAATRAEVSPLRQSKPSRSPRNVSASRWVDLLASGADASGLVPLGAAVPDAAWLPVKALRSAMQSTLRRAPDTFATYGSLAGESRLREKLRQRYLEMGCLIDADELLITNGCSEALHLALMAVGRPAGVVAVESPTYFGFLQLIERAGMKALEIPTHPHTGMDLAQLESALQTHAGTASAISCVLIVSSFGNPLGSCLPNEHKRALVQLSQRHRLPIIEDDLYGDLHFQPARPYPLKTFDTSGLVMLCSSFSKTLAPGSRVGWIAAGRWTDEVLLGKRVLSNATPLLMQDAISTYLDTHRYQTHLSRLRSRCADSVNRFTDAVERFFPAGTALSRPGGGFVLWVQMPKGVDAEEVFRKARRNQISILPGRAFSTGDQYRNCIRINCAREWDASIDAAVKRLGRLARPD